MSSNLSPKHSTISTNVKRLCKPLPPTLMPASAEVVRRHQNSGSVCAERWSRLPIRVIGECPWTSAYDTLFTRAKGPTFAVVPFFWWQPQVLPILLLYSRLVNTFLNLLARIFYFCFYTFDYYQARYSTKWAH